MVSTPLSPPSEDGPPPASAPVVHASGVHDIATEGSDMTRDIFVALFREKGRPSARSMPDVSDLLDQEVGRASEIAQPGGFRRDHVITTASPSDEVPHHVKQSFISQLSRNALHSTYYDFIMANIGWGGSDEDDYGLDDSKTPLTWRRPQLAGTFDEKEEGQGASIKKTVFTILKSFVGSGILFLPKGFENGGMLFSICGLIVSAIMSTFCMLRLTQCAETVAQRHVGGNKSVSYGQLGSRAFGKAGRVAVNISLVLSQLGFCCSYLIFVEKNIGDILTRVWRFNSESVASVSWILILLQVPLYTPLTWVRKLEYYALTNLFADLLILFGLFYIIYYSYHAMLEADPVESPPTWQNFNSKSWALFLGTAVYCFEGIGLVLPIYNAMEASVKHTFPRVLAMTILFLVTFFCFFAGSVYAAFGEDTQSVVTLNLPDARTSKGTVAVQVTYSLALILTYPLMLYPVISILEGYIFRNVRIKGARKWQKNGFRFALVCVTALIAYVGKEELDNFVALIGGFCSVPLAFIYPCLFHSKLVDDGHFANGVVVSIGLFTMLFASYQALSTWSG